MKTRPCRVTLRGKASRAFQGLSCGAAAQSCRVVLGVRVVRRRASLLGRVALFYVLAQTSLFGKTFQVPTPVGPIAVDVTHTGPRGELVAPSPPGSFPFRPPSIFSAPLPRGSGARALGFAGAFTAVADDATAASWNPAGLIQLQRPEASAVYRFSSKRNEHYSSSSSLSVGKDDTSDFNLNYFSLVYPLLLRRWDRPFVVSFNYQEAYDFSHSFTARFSQETTDRNHAQRSVNSRATEIQRFADNIFEFDVTVQKSTQTKTRYEQLLESEVLSDLTFEQEGRISALSPALAVEVTPHFSLGIALNYYLLDPLTAGSIKTRTRATYSGQTRSDVDSITRRTTMGSIRVDGRINLPGGQVNFTTNLDVEAFTDLSVSTRDQALRNDGVIEETNEIEELKGLNATLGARWIVSDHLTVGASVDLPWDANARQTRTTIHTVTNLSARGLHVTDVLRETSINREDVEFRFPLYWALGLLWRWTPQWYTTLDVSQTRWSEFSFKADGQERINPVDGSLHRKNPLDDTWAVRAGSEYLLYFDKIQIALRAGCAWEQRPAPDHPDDYYSLSLGSGVSMGDEPGKTALDCVYNITVGDNVRGIVPEESSLRSDVVEHQVFVSMIKHF